MFGLSWWRHERPNRQTYQPKPKLNQRLTNDRLSVDRACRQENGGLVGLTNNFTVHGYIDDRPRQGSLQSAQTLA